VAIGEEILWLHSYGNRCVDPSAGRPHGITDLVDRFGPRVLTTIPDTKEDMPEEIDHNAGMSVLKIGIGTIGPVSRGVYEYEVGGIRVLRHWFDYRARTSRHKKRSSILDSENAPTWTPAKTDELLALLTILDRCMALEAQQDDLLEGICAGALISATELTQAGILPVPEHARKAPPSVLSSTLPLF
jgi:hypothetical protein